MRLATILCVLSVSLFIGSGCSRAPSQESSSEHAHDEHAHAEEGPHGGHIIELGAEDHHAELTHDEASHKVGVYLLGADAATAAPAALESVTINVSEDGQPTQYVLPAVKQPGDPEGQASYFELVSEPLCDVVCGESKAKSVQARLSLKIGDKPYVGLIETAPHEHDHDHGHEH